jgi:hypothetical protein
MDPGCVGGSGISPEECIPAAGRVVQPGLVSEKGITLPRRGRDAGLITKNEFRLPFPPAVGVIDVPLPTPAKVFEFANAPSPFTVNTLLPPRLNCVVALSMFAVPIPLILKLLTACGEVVF